MTPTRNVTTRRGFIAALSFGMVSLYGVWAAFDAAPLPRFGGSRDGGHGGGHGATAPMAEAASHGDHGAPAGPSADDFRQSVEDFVGRYRQVDGSVWPRSATSADDSHGHGHGATPAAPSAEPVDVYFMAYRWGFEPAHLRLDADQPYRFRMMAVDVSHGASIQLGPASRIIRLRRGAIVEQELTFQGRGEYMVYCTVFCGAPHDQMVGRIVVV